MRYLLLPIILLTLCLKIHAETPLALPSPEDFTKLRMEFAQQPGFNPLWKIEPARMAIIEVYQGKDYQKAFDLAGSWLLQYPVDADIHFVRSGSANYLGDIVSATRHLYFAYGLLASIAESGDGKTPETAFKVISVSEEYSLLNDFGAKPIRQSLIEGPCDKMECQLPDGSPITYYFNVAISMAAMEKQMSGSK